MLFRDAPRDAEAKIEIRDTGAMGKGVFATGRIRHGTILGEYLGELLPLETAPDESDAYQSVLADKAVCSTSLPTMCSPCILLLVFYVMR